MAFLPFTIHHRYTVVSKKLLPVPALAWTIRRNGEPKRKEFTMCV